MENNLDEIYWDTVKKLMQDEYEKGMSIEEIGDKFNKDYLKNIVEGMNISTSEEQQRDYEGRIYEIIENLNSEKGDFLQELVQKWKNGFVLSGSLFSICIDALRGDEKKVHDTYLKKCLESIFIRSCKVYQEIYVLLSSGLADGAWARWRTLYELSIIGEFLVENGEEAAKKYYNSTDNSQYYNWAKKLPCFKEEYVGYKKNWKITFQAIYDKCKMPNPSWKKSYDAASNTIHASAKGTFYSFGGNDDNKSIIMGDLNGIEIPAIYSAQSLSLVAWYYLYQFDSLNSRALQKTILEWEKKIRLTYEDIVSQNNIRRTAESYME